MTEAGSKTVTEKKHGVKKILLTPYLKYILLSMCRKMPVSGEHYWLLQDLV